MADRVEAARPAKEPALLTAIETIRSLPTSRAIFGHAKIVYVMEGHVDIETAWGVHRLRPGAAYALGSGQWCRVSPSPSVRMWTLYADEVFLRAQMDWVLPDRTRVATGAHPQDWDGRPLVLHPGSASLEATEPVWRQISALRDMATSPEVMAVRTVQLFARAVEPILPALLVSGHSGSPVVTTPVTGHLTDSTTVGQIGRATRVLRERMDEPWTVTALAREVALSRAHLTRLFAAHAGISPMRFLAEVRLTEFTRLIEETDLSVARAAKAVGWQDPRVASNWFYRRYGLTPSQYRHIPHPHHSGERGLRSSVPRVDGA